MSLVDVALIVLAMVFALSGFRQGLIVSATSFVGFFGGAVIGAQLSGPIADELAGSSVTRVFVALVVVLAGALLGQLLAGVVGRAVRTRVTWEPAKVLDSVAGAVVSAAAVLLVAWMVAIPLASSPFPGVAAQVRESSLVQSVDRAVPEQVRSLYESLRDAIDRQGLPDVLDPLTPTQARDVPAPDQALLASPVVTQVRGSVVQIRGIAGSCARQIDGSGFVYADERVMTNAHVLAGVDRPTVSAEGQTYDATPVYVDEETDVAVLAVPGLPQVPLRFTPTPADTGDDAIVMGYPGGGGLYVGPARVRDRGPISGPDFRAVRTVERDVYALYGQVRAGNSGGPLLAPDGTVLGVVFASAIDDPDTGYALTYDQVETAAVEGQRAVAAVDTGACE
ncbi:MarP family serine protease [Modestobacter roseus]|uniref:Colicin V production protein n=1 Tax=Modestobacter roseus TaxID=1181884 RepID=A0A562IX14_9ACTN|nr:MarP family serine protease [Modestobacter roseus]MQA33949.1 MarP family serine protease [Modestobacter roseus]TWH75497.1 colicin V production protein [Modestobacter roseus]